MRHQLASSLQCPPSATSVSALTGVKGTRGGGKGQPKAASPPSHRLCPASSHATTAAQLGRVPIWLMAHLFQRDVFAATQYRLRFGQRIQAIIKCKGACHRRGETSPLPPLRRRALPFPLPSGSITGDSAFSECQFTAADAGTLPGSKICAAGLLPMIHRYSVVFYPTPQQHRQLNIRHRAKTAGQPVAGDRSPARRY